MNSEITALLDAHADRFRLAGDERRSIESMLGAAVDVGRQEGPKNGTMELHHEKEPLVRWQDRYSPSNEDLMVVIHEESLIVEFTGDWKAHAGEAVKFHHPEYRIEAYVSTNGDPTLIRVDHWK